MKKVQTFAIAAAALLVGLSGCKKETASEGSDVAAKSVFIKLDKATPISRAQGESGLTKTADFKKGVILFISGDEITRYVNVAESGSTTYAEPTDATIPTIDIDNLTAGVDFTNIKADKVYVIGNRTSAQLAGLPVQAGDGKVATGSMMTAVIKNSTSLLNVTSDVDMAGGNHAEAPLYGVARIVKDAVGDAYTAEVQIVPIVSRIEIKEIKGTDITFDVSGIFVNNYYTKVQVDGVVPVGTTLQNSASVVANYVQAYQATPMRDWSDIFLGAKTGDAETGFYVKPAVADNVWGYNIFPSKNPLATDKNTPHIVLRLKNVKDDKGVELTDIGGQVVDKFITVSGFTNGDGPVNEFKAGTIYTIESLSFDKSKLTEEPEIKDRLITAKVKVSVLQWANGGNITPDI